MNASTLASHEFCPNWMRPNATERSARLRQLAHRSLYVDLALLLGPGVLGIAALAALMFAMR